MVDRVLALHRVELPTAVQLCERVAAEDPAGSAPVLTTLDPVVHTWAALNGFPQLQLVAPPSIEMGTRVVPRGWAATRSFFAELDRVLAGLVPEAAASAWCGHWVQHLHLVSMGYRQLGEAIASRWQGDRVHVLLPDQAYAFGFHSFVPGLVLSQALRDGGVTVKFYSSGLPSTDATLLPDPFAGAGDDPELLCHLPTCFVDAAVLTREIAASGRRTLVLPSQFYDVETGGLPRAAMVAPGQLADRLPPPLLARIDASMQQVGERLLEHFRPLLPSPRYLQQQVQPMLDAMRNNALLFFALVQRFEHRPPPTILMSNHDTGIHGALFSFARRMRARLLLVPHAKIFNVPLKTRGLDLLCLTHPLQGGDVVDLNGQRMATATLDFGEHCRLPAVTARPLATLGIVLNTLSDMGLTVTDLDAYLDGLRRLRRWCADHGVTCLIRCRPNGNALLMLSRALGMPPEDLIAQIDGDIQSFGQRCDLVIGYDTPTSGAFSLLEEGVPVLQALCRPLGHEEWCIVDPDVVPQQPLEAVVRELDRFRAEPLALWTYRQAQLGRFIAARSAARPLRHWL